MANKKDYKVVPFPLGAKVIDRWCIVSRDDETVILDDAQGYGYRTARKAIASWSYKNRKNSKTPSKSQQIKSWLDRHEDINEDLVDLAFRAMKEGVELTADDVRSVLDEHGVKGSFTPSEILRVFKTKKL